MKRVFGSDHHFFHKNVIPYCNRPFSSIEEMNEAMIESWNSFVNPEDEVIYLGDLDINPKRSHRDMLHKLNGIKKLLIPGNHCIGFQHTTGMVSPKVLKERQTLLDYGWEEVCQTKQIALKNGRNVLLSHLPYLDEQTAEIDLRYKDIRPKNQGMVLICGHQHARYIKKGNMIDVGYDGKLGLYSEDEVIALIDDPRDFIPSRLTDFYNSSNPRVLEK